MGTALGTVIVAGHDRWLRRRWPDRSIAWPTERKLITDLVTSADYDVNPVAPLVGELRRSPVGMGLATGQAVTIIRQPTDQRGKI